MIDTETIGKIIKKLRVDKNYTQEKLAEKIDIYTNYLSKVERGLSRLNIEAFLKMAEVLSFSLDDFGVSSPERQLAAPDRQRLLEKVLSIPEKDTALYMQILDFTELLITNARK